MTMLRIPIPLFGRRRKPHSMFCQVLNAGFFETPESILEIMQVPMHRVDYIKCSEKPPFRIAEIVTHGVHDRHCGTLVKYSFQIEIERICIYMCISMKTRRNKKR